MRLKKIPYDFEFVENKRSKVTLGINTRLDPEGQGIMLVSDLSTGLYSTDDDLYVKTWIYNPSSCKGWIGFEVEDIQGMVDYQVVTSLGFRLSDGTDEYYWDGSDWSESTSEWNDEGEIANNISSFPYSDRKLQVVVNLKTTNSRATPIVKSIKVLFLSDIELKEDLIFSSFIGSLESQIRVKGRHLITLTEDSDELDLKEDYPLETPYNIPSIDGAYNHTDDPLHDENLLSSFNPTTRVVSLTGELESGKEVWVDFFWVPEFSVSTSLDFNEPEKVPCVILDDLKQLGGAGYIAENSVINRATGQGYLVEYAQADLEFLIRFMTDKAIDMLRLSDEVRRFFANNKLLRSVGLDREYDIRIVSDWDMLSSAGERGLIEANMTVQILRALFFEKEAEAVTSVTKLYLTGDFNQTVE